MDYIDRELVAKCNEKVGKFENLVAECTQYADLYNQKQEVASLLQQLRDQIEEVEHYMRYEVESEKEKI